MQPVVNALRLVCLFNLAMALGACDDSSLEAARNHPQEVVHLELSYGNLETLPSYVAKCTNVESISLVGNKLRSFPIDLTRLPKLKRLNLSGNAIDSIPIEIGRMQSLEALDLSSNKIRNIPPQLAGLSRLHSLDLSWNAIIELPADFSKMKQLREFKIYDNLLRSLDSVTKSFVHVRLETDYCLEANRAQYYLIRATQYHNSRNAPDASAYYTKAIQLDNTLAPAYGNRGLLKQQNGDLVGAIADFNQALNLDQQQPVIWLNRGVIRFNRGDKTGACGDWQNAAKLGDGQAANFLSLYCR